MLSRQWHAPALLLPAYAVYGPSHATPMAPENSAVYLGQLASSCGGDIITASVTSELDEGTVELVHAKIGRAHV